MSNQPVHRLRIGSISAAIFENKTQDGKTFYNAQFDRSYRDGETWKHTTSYGRDDLLILAKLADQIQQEKTDFGKALQEALHAHQEGQRWMVMTTAVGGSLISALTTLGLVVGLRYIGWLH